MGEAVRLSPGEQADPATVRVRLDRSIVALERMVADGLFGTRADTCGFEVELDLVDPLGRPRQVNDPVLAAMDRRDFQSELSRFNLEFNAEARPMRGALLSRLDGELAATIEAATAVAQRYGARVIAVGILPTLHADDLTAAYLSANPRYPLLDTVMAAVRGRSVRLDIAGRERLRLTTESIAVQGAATSLQVHVRVSPVDFARFFNAAQVAAPLQVAAGANSPFLLGRSLWCETRMPLITQSLDVRPSRRGSEPPRVWSGDAWAVTAVDVLADNVRRYTPLLPLLEAEDPLDELAAGRIPALHELRLHNGTIWRWNRPVYDVQHGYPHLRIENRVLPSGPTAVDMVANTALFLGLVRALADLDPPVTARWPFRTVTRDLHAAARDGLDARLHWPGVAPQRVRARGLLLDTVLPLAASGLDAWGVDAADRDRYLGVVEARVQAGRTGADWQVATVGMLEQHGADRELALREMVRRYVEYARTREPVHLWPV